MFEENIITNEDEALNFINKYGFVTLFPVKGINLPSLYRATKGSHEEKFTKAWTWADNLASKKQIHYGKLVHKQVTLMSLEMFPYFYRLCRENKLSETAQKISDFLKEHRKTSTTGLRKSLGFMQKGKKNEFLKAIDELQVAFAIAIVNREKPPKMTYTYDLMERWMPENLLKKAELIDKDTAKKKVITKMLENNLIPTAQDAEKLLGLK